MGRVLTFNCHEGYVHLLGRLGLELDVIDGLPGRYVSHWDTRMRPVPPGARLVTLEAAKNRSDYDAIICHNVTDLMDVRLVEAPKILILHVSLTARTLEDPNAPPAREMSLQLRKYLDLIGGSAVAVSEAKRASFGLDATVIRPAVDENEWPVNEGNEAVLLRVANQVTARRARFAWDDHEKVVRDFPFRLVGHNPDIPGAAPSKDWDDLRSMYRSHRAYVHTAADGLDDGYNLSLLEAMVSGMPALSTAPSESPVIDGVNGFVDANPGRIHDCARKLLDDPTLARELGARARETVLEHFGLRAFVENWHRAIERARVQFRSRKSPTELALSGRA